MWSSRMIDHQFIVVHQNGRFNSIVSVCSKISPNHWHLSVSIESKTTSNQLDSSDFFHLFCTINAYNSRIFSVRSEIYVRMWSRVFHTDHYDKCHCHLFDIHLTVRKDFGVHWKLWGIHWSEWVYTLCEHIIISNRRSHLHFYMHILLLKIYFDLSWQELTHQSHVKQKLDKLSGSTSISAMLYILHTQ